MRHSIRRPFKWVFLALGGLVLAAVLAFLFGLIVMALWNWLMPELFGIRAISYWEAWGLVLLAHILFKLGGHGNHRSDHDRDEEWKERFRRRFKDRFFESDRRKDEGAAPGDRAPGGEEAPKDRPAPGDKDPV